MTIPLDLDPQLTLVGGLAIVPVPTLVALVQNGSYVQAIVVLPALSGGEPITGFRLYRAPSALGPTWTLVDTVPVSPISTYNNLFDLAAGSGHTAFYAATAASALGAESLRCPPQSIAPYATT